MYTVVNKTAVSTLLTLFGYLITRQIRVHLDRIQTTDFTEELNNKYNRTRNRYLVYNEVFTYIHELQHCLWNISNWSGSVHSRKCSGGQNRVLITDKDYVADKHWPLALDLSIIFCHESVYPCFATDNIKNSKKNLVPNNLIGYSALRKQSSYFLICPPVFLKKANMTTSKNHTKTGWQSTLFAFQISMKLSRKLTPCHPCEEQWTSFLVKNVTKAGF